MRLALLLSDEHPDTARRLCRQWKASNAFCDRVVGILTALREPLPTDPFSARRFVCTHWGHFADAFALRALLGEAVEQIAALCKTVAKNGTAIEIKRLAVNGRELQEQLGVLPARTGALLARLQELCWQEPSRNKKIRLMELAREITEQEEGWKRG